MLSNTMATSRSGLFCAAFNCSNNKSVQKARYFFRFQKEQFVGCLYKKNERSDCHWWPVSNKLSRPYGTRGRGEICVVA